MLRSANYAYYTSADVATVLKADDIPHPTNRGYEPRRALVTLAGWEEPPSSCFSRTSSKNAPPKRRHRQSDPAEPTPP